MHELAQLPPLLKKIQELKAVEHAHRVLRAYLRIGPFFPLSPGILKSHLAEAVQGSDLEETEWVIRVSAEPELPGPAEILLEELDLTE